MGVRVKFDLTEAKSRGNIKRLQEKAGMAEADLDYVERKLWVRVDELKGGRPEAAVLGTLSKDSAGVKIPKFLDSGIRDLDAAANEASTLSKELNALTKDMTTWKVNYNRVVLHGKMPGAGLEKWIIQMAKDLDAIRTRLWMVQGIEF